MSGLMDGRETVGRARRHRGGAARPAAQYRAFPHALCLLVFFSLASPSFATLDNVSNILTQISVTGIIAVGLTFVILCAEIDLSSPASPMRPGSSSPISPPRNAT